MVDNGNKVLAELERNSYDLILMDLQMPELDGLNATMMIRKKELMTGKHIPIIAMTAYALEDDKARCLNSGIDGHLAKPSKMNDLYEIIEHILKN